MKAKRKLVYESEKDLNVTVSGKKQNINNTPINLINATTYASSSKSVPVGFQHEKTTNKGIIFKSIDEVQQQTHYTSSRKSDQYTHAQSGNDAHTKKGIIFRSAGTQLKNQPSVSQALRKKTTVPASRCNRTKRARQTPHIAGTDYNLGPSTIVSNKINTCRHNMTQGPPLEYVRMGMCDQVFQHCGAKCWIQESCRNTMLKIVRFAVRKQLAITVKFM
ncbi:hypothetical protein CTI12_AA480010 [Artemisia annua]|uniref:Uncharacterized protein n=1 Tax=Artemisia annua TaxID=35608 RepID=A0A2U1LH98_ARTAN|nr:hypothetical protein CTI12_AA480010 [Artemisia annua]